MSKSIKIFSKFLALLALVAVTASCSSNGTKPEQAAMEMYEVHHEGRIHVFYDRHLYQEFLQMGETPFRLTRIGAGPKGETVVFGLTKHDKKMKTEIPAIAVFDGKREAGKNFYGEMRSHGRIYVFDGYEEMVHVRMHGHPNLFYTEIGSGPKGETVVYVLNEHNKKKRPDALIKKFKEMN